MQEQVQTRDMANLVQSLWAGSHSAGEQSDDVADYCAKYVAKEGAWWDVKRLSHRHPQNPSNLKLTGNDMSENQYHF